MKKYFLLFLILVTPFATKADYEPCFDLKTDLAPGYYNEMHDSDLALLKIFLRSKDYLGDPELSNTPFAVGDDKEPCRGSIGDDYINCVKYNMRSRYGCDSSRGCQSLPTKSEYTFDRATEVALSKFQKDYGLQGLGMLGPKTRQVIKDLSCKTIPLTTEVKKAQDTLTNFYRLASLGKYAEAARLTSFKTLGGKGETPSSMESDWWAQFPANFGYKGTKGEILSQWCKNMGTCLKIRKVVDRYVRGGDYVFKVQFTAKNGPLFKYGPCCGGTGKPITEFEFKVRKISGVYKVIDPPIYTP